MNCPEKHNAFQDMPNYNTSAKVVSDEIAKKAVTGELVAFKESVPGPTMLKPDGDTNFKLNFLM